MTCTPDIEIYLKTKDLQVITQCLEQIFSQAITFNSEPPFQACLINDIPIKVYLKVKSGFSSIWFDSSHTPWENDLHCAQEFQKITGLICRCIKSSWAENETEDPDLWLEVNNQGQKELIWK